LRLAECVVEGLRTCGGYAEIDQLTHLRHQQRPTATLGDAGSDLSKYLFCCQDAV
jgi:hypothetical protein